MIEAARKQPMELAEAIQQPILNATIGSSSSSGGPEVLRRMKVELGSSMQEIKARVLPGPWLNYRQGRTGKEETQTFYTGTSGTWNMNHFKFSSKKGAAESPTLAVLESACWWICHQVSMQ
jgi:hypothetical protein